MRYTALILASALSFAFFYVGLLISNEYGVTETKNVFVPFFIFTLFLLCLFLFLNNIYYDEAIEIKQEFDEGKAEMSIYEREYEKISKEILQKKQDIETMRSKVSNVDIEGYLEGKLKLEKNDIQPIKSYGDNLGIAILPKAILEDAKDKYDNAVTANDETKKKNIVKALKVLLFKNLSVVNYHDNNKLREVMGTKKNIDIQFKADENDTTIKKKISVQTLFKNGDGKLTTVDASKNDEKPKSDTKEKLVIENIDIPLTLKNIYEARIDAPNTRDKTYLTKLYNDVIDVYYDNMSRVLSSDISSEIAKEKIEYERDRDKLQVIKNLLDKKEKALEKDIKDKINKADNKLYVSGLEILYDGKDKNKYEYTKNEKKNFPEGPGNFESVSSSPISVKSVESNSDSLESQRSNTKINPKITENLDSSDDE